MLQALSRGASYRRGLRERGVNNVMAKVFTKSHFFGFDCHDKSIEATRESAKREGCRPVTFELVAAGGPTPLGLCGSTSNSSVPLVPSRMYSLEDGFLLSDFRLK